MRRFRFAPSASGPLHVGSVRTYFANWLMARKVGAELVLSIEHPRTAPDAEDHARWCRGDSHATMLSQIAALGLLPDTIWIDAAEPLDRRIPPDSFYAFMALDRDVTDAVRARGTIHARLLRDEQEQAAQMDRPGIATHWIGAMRDKGVALSKSGATWIEPEALAGRYGASRVWRCLATTLSCKPLDWMAVTPAELADEIELPFSEDDVELEDFLRML